MATYSHDYSHCSQTDCPLFEKCYRGFLHRNIKNSGWTTASYIRPQNTGEDCDYFLDMNNY